MKNLYKKLIEIQAEIKPIEKDSQNPHFKNYYFDISGLLAAVKPILTKYGVILMQPLVMAGERAAIQTVLIDADSGEAMESMTFLPEVTDPQKFGAAVSYYRRYALTSLLALEGEDTDAEGVNTAKTQPSPVTATTAPTTAAGAKCSSCGAPIVHNPRTGKDFCQDKCWLKPQVAGPAVADEEIPPNYFDR